MDAPRIKRHRPSPGSLGAARGLYDLLGVPRAARMAQIRTAYRKRALATHPDKGGKPEDFRQVVAAFEVLSDQEQRQAYDEELKRTGQRDGLGCEAQEHDRDEASPKKGPRNPRVQARLAHLKFLKLSARDSAEFVRGMSIEVLEALVMWLSEKLRDRSRVDDEQENVDMVAAAHEDHTMGNDPSSEPKRVEPPEGLPRGWTCLSHLYKTGPLKGKNYLRFTSPWGQKGFMSVKSAIKADAEHRGEDGTLAAFQWEQRKKNMQPQGQANTCRAAQRTIYATRSAHGVTKYWVQMMWSSMTVSTRRTMSLAEAVDWHIALTQASATARLRAAQDAAAPPLTPEELLQLLEVEPNIQLCFRSIVACRGRYVSVPTTRDLDLALSLLDELRALVRQGSSQEKLQQYRRDSSGRVLAREKELQALDRQLLRAAKQELRARKAPGQTGRYLTKPAEAQLQKQPELGPDAQTFPNLEFPPAAAAHQVAALELLSVLGLNSDGARALSVAIRALPKAELRRRLQALQAPLGHARTHLRESSYGTAQKAAGGTQNRSLSTAGQLQQSCDGTAYKAAGKVENRSLSRAGQFQESFDGTTREATTAARSSRLSGGAHLALPPAPDPPKRSGSDGLQSPPCVEIAMEWLCLADICCVRGASCAATDLADIEIMKRCRDFSYYPRLFEPRHLRSTRRGRLLAVPLKDLGRKLVLFLTERRHAMRVVNLDLSHAPVCALETPGFQAVLSTGMESLKHVTLPYEGWSGPSDRLRFLGSLPKGVSFEWDHPGRKTPPLAVQRESAATSGQLVDLAGLIPKWGHLSNKEKHELHTHLRAGAAAGLFPARSGRKWEWHESDPCLPAVRAHLGQAWLSA
eukprot:TRINITY_DN41219_c0_g1_i1.p1 TRINITY_DN41219_c0_g1~~TRINITY_DN41219_c0_g1_i1.p1  ORF type:complete len:929 (-),score=144.27 TRINITY_DN41219_c0_g1_i1:78-2660(-)